MLRFLKSFFGKVRTEESNSDVPYKVETPVPAAQPQCGCGRSASGFCVGLHKLTAEEWAAHPDNPAKPSAEPAPAKKKAPAKKPAAAKDPAKKKPAAIKAAPKKKKDEPK